MAESNHTYDPDRTRTLRLSVEGRVAVPSRGFVVLARRQSDQAARAADTSQPIAIPLVRPDLAAKVPHL